MPVYKVVYEITLPVVADSPEEAMGVARNHLGEELDLSGDEPFVAEIKSRQQIPPEFRGSIPWGPDSEDEIESYFLEDGSKK